MGEQGLIRKFAFFYFFLRSVCCGDCCGCGCGCCSFITNLCALLVLSLFRSFSFSFLFRLLSFIFLFFHLLNVFLAAVFHDISTSDPIKKKKRWSTDRDLLKIEWERKPNRTRTAFYLAQSYECLGDYQNAYKWYQVRWNLKGWNEEAYEARYIFFSFFNYFLFLRKII